MSQVWKKCSSCKKDILLNRSYYVCSVSTCQHKRKGFQFCSVSCWSAHVPVLRHRDAWAEERTSPAKPEPTEATESPKRRIVRSAPVAPQASTAVGSSRTLPVETLIVVSKLKNFIKEASDYNTSADVIDCLSDHVRKISLQAVKNAQLAGRKTVMARDFDL